MYNDISGNNALAEGSLVNSAINQKYNDIYNSLKQQGKILLQKE